MLEYGRHHGNEAPWRTGGRAYRPPGKLVGIELEYENASRFNRQAVLDAVDIEVNGGGNSPYAVMAERDGSLDDERGTEFITPPMPYSLALRKDAVLRKLARTLEKFNSSDQRNDVGLHVNVNASEAAVDEIRSMVWFFNMTGPFSSAVGGRLSPRYAPFKPHSLIRSPASTNPVGWTKYAAAWHNSNRIEVRFHKSTTDEQLLANRVAYSCLGTEFAASKRSMFMQLNNEVDSYFTINNQLRNEFLAWLSLRRGKYSTALFTFLKGLTDTKESLFSAEKATWLAVVADRSYNPQPITTSDIPSALPTATDPPRATASWRSWVVDSTRVVFEQGTTKEWVARFMLTTDMDLAYYSDRPGHAGRLEWRDRVVAVFAAKGWK